MITVEKTTIFRKGEIEELTEATMDAIKEGIGFGWINPPPKNKVKDYWKGVLLVPNRWLFLGRYKGLIAGSLQVVTFSSTNEASMFRVFIENHFVATWARGHGLAKLLIEEAEKECIIHNFSHVLLDVRETQNRAIRLYEQMGYNLWGQLPAYHKLANDVMVSGKYFYKYLGESA
ncbi:MAG: GNAT family N-acetyltransferase [Pseudomonadota bacterium]|nr:GNAT family N-acetyltransferase [Pseudomonadota bacterium]